MNLKDDFMYSTVLTVIIFQAQEMSDLFLSMMAAENFSLRVHFQEKRWCKLGLIFHVN